MFVHFKHLRLSVSCYPTISIENQLILCNIMKKLFTCPIYLNFKFFKNAIFSSLFSPSNALRVISVR